MGHANSFVITDSKMNIVEANLNSLAGKKVAELKQSVDSEY